MPTKSGFVQETHVRHGCRERILRYAIHQTSTLFAYYANITFQIRVETFNARGEVGVIMATVYVRPSVLIRATKILYVAAMGSCIKANATCKERLALKACK